MKNGVTRMRAMVKAGVLVCGAVLLMGGCANQQRLDQAMDENRSLKNSNNELQAVNAQLRTENELLQKQRSANEAALASANALANELKGKLGLTEEEYKTLLDRLNNMKFGEIDPVTDKALRDLAAAHPDLITYDPELGRLRFASDLTFDSGQDRVKEAAAQSLGALARILKTTSASGYEVMIVGHTDAQKISTGTAQRHPTNMHLSCHRAIAVRQALASQSVPEDKMYAAGWGEQRPIAQGDAKGNSPANRRVEIYLTKSTAMAGMAPKTTPPPAKMATEPDMTK